MEVRLRRRSMGIPAFSTTVHHWTHEDEKLLGTRPDTDIALLIGATLKAVRHRRLALGIALCPQQREAVRRDRAKHPRIRRQGGRGGTWIATEEQLLGTMSDEDLARQIGRTRFSVQARRIHLKIDKFDPKLRQWKPTDDVLLGTLSDRSLAKKLGITYSAVAHRRRRLGIPVRFANRIPWAPENDTLLGTCADTELAARFNCSVASICMRRQKLGIPNFCRHRWVPEHHRLLGLRPDSEVAQELGCSEAAVKGRRQMLRIKPHR